MTIPSEQEQRLWWRLRWLSSIQAFADAQTQRERWLDPAERNPHFSFVECLCCYFDDAFMGDDDAYAKKLARGHLSEAEMAAVAEFHALADAYRSPAGDDWDAAAILADPAWQEVVEAAREAQRQLLGVLFDPDEIAMLSRPLEWREEGGTFRADFIGSTIVH